MQRLTIGTFGLLIGMAGTAHAAMSGCDQGMDFDGNGTIGSGDLAMLLGNWGTDAYDLDGDGVVGSHELATLLGQWGQASPTADPMDITLGTVLTDLGSGVYGIEADVEHYQLIHFTQSGGCGPFTYEWSLNGQPIVDGERNTVTETSDVGVQTVHFDADVTDEGYLNIVHPTLEYDSERDFDSDDLTLTVTDSAGNSQTVGPLRLRVKWLVEPGFSTLRVTAAPDLVSGDIALSWPELQHGASTTFDVYRLGTGFNPWEHIADLGLGATSFVVEEQTPGQAETYQVTATHIDDGSHYRIGYVTTGVEVDDPAQDDRGRMLLVVDETWADDPDIRPRIDRLAGDLAHEGWTVDEMLAPRHDEDNPSLAADLRATLQDVYSSAPDLEAVLLLGSVPVAKALISADGHGARPGGADAFYADLMTEDWEDWEDADADGVYDELAIPSVVELQLGRVDFANMSEAYGEEKDLLVRYLDKNHAFRRGAMLGIPARALHYFEGYYSAQHAPALVATQAFGDDGIWRIDDVSGELNLMFPFVYEHQALWANSFMTPTEDEMTAGPIQAVFTTWFRSGLLNWWSNPNALRGSLANEGPVLTAVYGGRPPLHAHEMALGATIGHAVRTSQNNGFYGAGRTYSELGTYGSRNVHMSLMGDPSLTQDLMAPTTGLTGTSTGSGATLEWDVHPEAEWYRIYGSEHPLGPFTRLGEVVDNSYSVGGSHPYLMVRPVRIETTGAGSYVNVGPGESIAVADL